MANTAELALVISLKDQASKGLGGISKSVGALGTAVGVFAGGAALAGVQALGSAVSGFLSDAITESRDAAKGFAQTEAVIKSTGGAAGVTAKQIVELAGSLSHTTLFTDDAIQAQQNLLLTFTNVQNAAGEGNDIFTQTSKIGLDMAQALGTDAAGAALQLGKALNDPTKGISALTRVGVTFTDQQKNQIKTLQASGDMIGAQKIILAELSKEFGGSAEAAAKADGGFHLFQQRMDDVKQTVGDALMPALTGIMGLMAGPVLDAVESLGKGFAGGLTTAVAWLTTTGIPGAISIFGSLKNVVNLLATGDFSGGIFGLDEDSPLIGFLLKMREGFIIARDTVLTFIQALSGDWVNASGIQPFTAAVGEVGLALRDFANWIVTIGQQIAGGDWSGAFATLTSGLTSFGSTLLTTLAGWGTAFLDWIGPMIPPLLAKLGELTVAVGTWIVEQAPIWGAQLLAWGQGFIDWVAPMIPPALAALGALVTSIGTWIVEQIPVIGAQLLAWGTAFVNWVAPMIPPALAALGTLITSIGAWVVEQVPILISQLIAWGTAFVEWVGPMIPPAIAALAGLASGVIGWIGEQAAPILARLSAWATAFIAWIPGATVTFLQQWPGFLSSFLGWIGEAAGPLLLKLGEWAVQFVAWIVPMIPGFLLALAGIAAALITFIAETVIVIAAKVYEWSTAFGAWIGSDLVPKLPGLLGAITDSIGGWITGTAVPWLTTAAADLGTAIIDGVKGAISSGAKFITEAIKSALTAALEAAKRALGISSPSTVFANEVGKPIVQGITTGVQAGMPDLLRTVTSGLGAAITAAKTMGSKLSSIGGTFTLGMGQDDLRKMPDVIAAMRESTDSLIQEIVGFLDDPQGGHGPYTQAGIDAINAFIAGMKEQAPGVAAALSGMVKAAKGARGGVGTLGGPDSGDAATSTGGGDPAETFAPRPVAAAEGTQAGAGAGMGFGDGWKTGLEQIGPVIQDTTRATFMQLHEVVLLPWQEDTRTFFGGAGFGFIGAASVGIMSAAGGMAEVAGAAGGMAGSSLVSTLSSAAAGVGGVVGQINSALGSIERNITITITTVYKEVGKPA